MTYEVRWSEGLMVTISARFGTERSPEGRPSGYDFLGGPLDAATRRFAEFESLPTEAGPSVRSVHVIDPVFGAVAFVGVLVEPGVVEIAAVDIDEDYWRLIDDDPDD